MDLIVAATNKEISPFISASENNQKFKTFVSGAGCLESTLSLTRFLCNENPRAISRVIHVGIAGAFQKSGLQLLDFCMAEQEIFADFGVCYEDRIDNLDFPGCPENTIVLDNDFRNEFNHFLEIQDIPVVNGTFLTVNCVSGTGKRGDYLQEKHKALCENMEGFAVARVCQEFHLPCLEIRCISNFVEDRNHQNWLIDEACEKLGHTLLPFL